MSAEVPDPARRFAQIATGVHDHLNQVLPYPFAQASLSSFCFDIQEERMIDGFMPADDTRDTISATQRHLVVTALSSRASAMMGGVR